MSPKLNEHKAPGHWVPTPCTNTSLGTLPRSLKTKQNKHKKLRENSVVMSCEESPVVWNCPAFSSSHASSWWRILYCCIKLTYTQLTRHKRKWSVHPSVQVKALQVQFWVWPLSSPDPRRHLMDSRRLCPLWEKQIRSLACVCGCLQGNGTLYPLECSGTTWSGLPPWCCHCYTGFRPLSSDSCLWKCPCHMDEASTKIEAFEQLSKLAAHA